MCDLERDSLSTSDQHWIRVWETSDMIYIIWTRRYTVRLQQYCIWGCCVGEEQDQAGFVDASSLLCAFTELARAI